MLSAGLYGADGIILDLEDSVPPAQKDSARLLVRNALIALDWGAAERMVRVNQGERGLEDLRRGRSPQPARRAAAQGRGPGRGARGRRRSRRERRAGRSALPDADPGVRRSASTGRSRSSAADPSVVALTLGLEDLSADLGAPRTEEGGRACSPARPWSTPPARPACSRSPRSTPTVDDEAVLEAYVRRERALGFDGIGCIHPRQIPVIHRAMTPPEAAGRARRSRSSRAAREAEARGLGAVAPRLQDDRPAGGQAGLPHRRPGGGGGGARPPTGTREATS